MKEQLGIASNPEDYRTVYQLQFDSNPTQIMMESPLFLNIKHALSEIDVRQPVDILFADQLADLSREENKR